MHVHRNLKRARHLCSALCVGVSNIAHGGRNDTTKHVKCRIQKNVPRLKHCKKILLYQYKNNLYSASDAVGKLFSVSRLDHSFLQQME
ncbi:hypothetical protein PR048_010944, partial [Dryococelus australis]